MPTLVPGQHHLRTAMSLAYASRAAYKPKPLAEAQFKKLGWDRLRKITNKKTKTFAFVASNADNIVVAFRGTEPKEIQNWLTNLNAMYHKRKVNGGKVHDGFWTAWLTVNNTVIDTLKEVHNNHQPIWFTGHSLGGALASLAGRNMPAKLRPMAIHTFGQPRVGNLQYANKYNVELFRFVNEDDIVTHVPIQGLGNTYTHVGQRQLIQANGKITSSRTVWNRLLNAFAKSNVIGAGLGLKKSISDHSMTKYIAKLAKHSLNKGR